MKSSLGALQYHWPRQTILTSYEAIAGLAGGHRLPGRNRVLAAPRAALFRLDDNLMRDAGKEAVLSTQGAGIGRRGEWRTWVTANPDYPIEANDMGAVQRLAGQRPFVGGLHLNIANQPRSPG